MNLSRPSFVRFRAFEKAPLAAALRAWSAALFAASLAGCSGYSVKYGGTGDGYDVFRPEPYLLVDRKAEVSSGITTVTTTARIIWLPNYAERYRVSSNAHLGKADFTFKFEDGWRLTSVEDKSDNSELAGKLLDLIKTVVPVPEKTAVRGEATPEDFDLYRLKFDRKTGEFLELVRVSKKS